MQSQARRPLHPLIWIAGIFVIVFCGAGAAAFMGWIPGTASKPSEPGLSSKLDKPRTAAKVHSEAKAPVAAICAHCGVVQSVHEVQAKGDGSAVGVVGGAVVGGILGNQVGHGDGRKVATVIGAVGGAVAGNEVEKYVKSSKSYEITVRFNDGSSGVITEPGSTTWRTGDKVKVLNGVLQSNA